MNGRKVFLISYYICVLVYTNACGESWNNAENFNPNTWSLEELFYSPKWIGWNILIDNKDTKTNNTIWKYMHLYPRWWNLFCLKKGVKREDMKLNLSRLLSIARGFFALVIISGFLLIVTSQ